MSEIIFFKGNHETIILPENSPKVKIFYSEIYNLLSQKEYKQTDIETNSNKQLKETIS